MINTDILSIYYGGVIVFTKQVFTQSGGVEKIYKVGEEVHITPAILYMVGAGIIPQNSIKPILRQLHQLEDSEVIELSRLIVPSLNKKGLLSIQREVHRQGERKGYTVEVILEKKGVAERSMVINSAYDIAISEIIYPPYDGKPIVTQIAAPNQIKANRWLIKKHLDVFGLIPQRLATGRKHWGKDGYETPNSPRFK